MGIYFFRRFSLDTRAIGSVEQLRLIAKIVCLAHLELVKLLVTNGNHFREKNCIDCR